MDITGGGAVEPPSWFEASERTLDPLLTAASLLALVEGAEASGLMRALRHPTTVSDAARETGLPEARVRDICDALVAGEVLESRNSGVRLTADWDVLSSSTAFASLADSLRMNDVTTRSLRDLSGELGFADLSAADRLAYAVAVSPNPFSPGLVAAVRQGAWTPATIRVRVHEEARHLELGCGVAGRILCALQAFPSMTAVGVELDPDLAAEARWRSERLGVADRLDVVRGDATTVRLEGLFDVVTWSQFFFAEVSRAGALATAYAALKPGGLLLAPLLGDDDAAAAKPHGTQARSLAVSRVVHGGWGVPGRSATELVDELTASGFADAGVTPAAESPFRVVYATRP